MRPRSKWPAMLRARRAGAVSVGAALLFGALMVSLAFASIASANGVPLEKGDVLAGVGNGIIKHFDSSGKLLDEISNERETTYVTGMCFDSASNLYATDFNGGMSKFDQNANLLVSSFGEGFNSDPESCAVDSANNLYVGQADGEAEILKFDTSGKLLASYAPEREDRGTDWIDLAADGCTIHYTSEGDAIKAFNVCTNKQLPDVATELPGPCYAHRILADGSELVACSTVVEHVNASGEIIQTYTPGGTGELFALNLDPDGTTFWTGDLSSGEVWRINIATGAVVTTFNAGINTALGGLTIVGEITQTPRIELAPVTAENPVGTTHTLTATVTEKGKAASGVKVHFTVTGANPQTGEATTTGAGEASFTYKGENEGTDSIVASFTDAEGKLHESNTATKVWVGPEKGTTLATSLAGGGQEGGTITVKEGTAVTDGATLSGKNAGSASGTVDYKVYSDKECTSETADAGTVTVTDGSVPASNPETLSPGTYYWQATYSGDANNDESKSPCRSEIETVEGPPPPQCTKAIGRGTFKTSDERVVLTNKLFTELSKKQQLLLRFEHGAQNLKLTHLTAAECKETATNAIFEGTGPATLNGETGYTVHFRLVQNKKTHRFAVRAKITKPEEETLRVNAAARALSSEEIS